MFSPVLGQQSMLCREWDSAPFPPTPAFTFVSSSVFYHPWNSVLLVKPKPKDHPLSSCSFTSNPCPGMTGSACESLCSSPSSRPPPGLILDDTVPPTSAHFPANSSALRTGANAAISQWIGHLPAKALRWPLPLFTDLFFLF